MLYHQVYKNNTTWITVLQFFFFFSLSLFHKGGKLWGWYICLWHQDQRCRASVPEQDCYSARIDKFCKTSWRLGMNGTHQYWVYPSRCLPSSKPATGKQTILSRTGCRAPGRGSGYLREANFKSLKPRTAIVPLLFPSLLYHINNINLINNINII